MDGFKYINISLDFFCGTICLIILFFAGTSEYRKKKESQIFIRITIVNILLLFTDAVNYLLDSNPNPKIHFPLVVTACLIAAYGPILLIFLTDLVFTTIKNKTSVSKAASFAMFIAAATCIVDIICIVATQFNHMYFLIDENNLLVRQDWFLLSQFFAFLCMAINAGVLIAHKKFLKKRELFILLSYEAIPAFAVLVQILIEGFSIINFSITLAILLYFAGILNEMSKQLKQNELELTESRISVMLSQIKPHFLYNSLTAIAQLCDENPIKAKKATIDFSSYLRRNMDSLSNKGLISFEKELDHIKGYLSLEKAIYGKALNIIYNIETAEFSLPPLTVQPIVENAVKHGIGQREGGGTVTVSVFETDREYRITVSDDGIGYDTNELLQNDSPHIGIDNVKRRLMEQCGGSLEIMSDRGRGTTAVVIIPKKGVLA